MLHGRDWSLQHIAAVCGDKEVVLSQLSDSAPEEGDEGGWANLWEAAPTLSCNHKGMLFSGGGGWGCGEPKLATDEGKMSQS